MKHRWAGHVARKEDNVIVKEVMEWRNRNWWAVEKGSSQCQRRSRRGVPKKRWEDPIQNYMKARHGDIPWQQLAHDKKKWRESRQDFVKFHKTKMAFRWNATKKAPQSRET